MSSISCCWRRRSRSTLAKTSASASASGAIGKLEFGVSRRPAAAVIDRLALKRGAPNRRVALISWASHLQQDSGLQHPEYHRCCGWRRSPWGSASRRQQPAVAVAGVATPTPGRGPGLGNCRNWPIVRASARQDPMPDHAQGKDVLVGEEAIIALLAPLAAAAAGAFGLQDDCAVLQPEVGRELVLKTDPIAEGVHFLPQTAAADVAWKALAVNVSDLAAKGAAPRAYLLALSFPAAPQRGWVAEFAAGLRQAQERFGCHLIGGDTDRRPGPLTVSITLIGSVPQGRMVRRGTARAGDGLFVSGTLGDAALGLMLARDPTRAAAWRLSREM